MTVGEQGPSLSTLPSSVISQITADLSSEEQSGLRLCCRALAGTVRELFTHVEVSWALDRVFSQHLQIYYPSMRSLCLVEPLISPDLQLLR